MLIENFLDIGRSMYHFLQYIYIPMFEEELPQMLYQWDVPDSAVLTTYHSLHIQHLKRSS